MVTDKQFADLKDQFNDLKRQFAKISQDMTEIQMRFGLRKVNVPEETKRNRKDTTRYKFDGKLWNKRQLVLECIKKYTKEHPEKNWSELAEIFPDYIQGSLGVIRSAEEAEKYQDATIHYFFEDPDIIYLMGKQYVVCKDWTVHNIDRFISLIGNLGYEIEVIKREWKAGGE